MLLQFEVIYTSLVCIVGRGAKSNAVNIVTLTQTWNFFAEF
jgi:hypothetical protein